MPKSHHSKTTPGDILIVDDETANLKLLEELLSREGHLVRPADLPQLAIDSALAQPPALILLDVRMPDMDGFEVCKRLKQDERTRDVPVIFISALHEVKDKVQGFEAGGMDFITKPFQEEEVLARVRTHMDLHNMQLNLEEMVAKRTAELESEINERKQAEKKLARSEAKYRGLVENALVGVFNSTLEGRFIFINDAMARIFDFDTPEQMMAQGSLERWSDPKDRERMLVELQQHGRVTNFEAETITHTNRHIHVLFSARQLGNNIVGMVIDITERKQTEQKILEYQQRLKALASQLTIVEETERRRIAADLHDHVGQSLALVRLQIASVRKLLFDPGQTDTLDEISGTLQQTVQETRDLIYDLSPPQLHEIGLSAAILEWLEEHVEKRYKIKSECISSGPEKQLDKNLGAILFRNTRELVTNVIKHSHAKQVKVRVLQDDNHVKIFVKDDGIGFDAGAVSPSLKGESSFGLFSITERMADMGGSLEIVSEPGQGTEAIMHVPLEKGKG